MARLHLPLPSLTLTRPPARLSGRNDCYRRRCWRGVVFRTRSPTRCPSPACGAPATLDDCRRAAPVAFVSPFVLRLVSAPAISVVPHPASPPSRFDPSIWVLSVLSSLPPTVVERPPPARLLADAAAEAAGPPPPRRWGRPPPPVPPPPLLRRRRRRRRQLPWHSPAGHPASATPSPSRWSASSRSVRACRRARTRAGAAPRCARRDLCCVSDDIEPGRGGDVRGPTARDQVNAVVGCAHAIVFKT